jgi:hypothetical protein
MSAMDSGQVYTMDPLWETASAESEKNDTVDGNNYTKDSNDEPEMDHCTDEHGVTLKLHLNDGR